MPDKPKVGFYWCASCGGCEESVVDLAEDILGIINAIDIVVWPVAMDYKRSDIEAMDDGAILATMVNGAIRTSEQEEMVRLLRRKSELIVAYGSCAHLGGIPGLANQFKREEILHYVYKDSPSTVNETNIRPARAFKPTGDGSKPNGMAVTLPEFRAVVRALDQVIDVDYYLPGCPPVPKLLKQAVETLLAAATSGPSAALPPKGTVLAPDIALCDECPRKETKPIDLSFTEFKRPHWTALDSEKCLLAQGIVCMGPATRGGCGAQCCLGNMPCTGCFGPTSRVKDQGAKILSSISANVYAKVEEEIDRTLSSIPDPVGTFYRYGLPASLLRRKVM